MKSSDLEHIIHGRTVEIFDGTDVLGRGVAQLGASQVTVFTKEHGGVSSGNVVMRSYRAVLEAADCAADVCMLNDRAVKVLLAMYPSAPKHVFIRLTFRKEWILCAVGLVRRLIFGLVQIKGFATLRDDTGRRTYWLVITQRGGVAYRVPVLPKKVGVPAFLKWLQEEGITYVVLRFFERLPELYRKGGDIDLLVSYEDKVKIVAFLKKNEHLLSETNDDIRLGIHAVSGEPGIIPYYPPPLARQILDRSIEGPAGSRIPAPQDALNAFIYHVLYHGKKGYAAGIPSEHKTNTEQFPENDYLEVIERMAHHAGVELAHPITMESLDEYMADEGWRPKLDTLAKIAETNAWVRDHFFSRRSTGPAGLAVFMMREWAHQEGLSQEMVDMITSRGFSVLRSKVLSEEEKHRAAENLRGGTWGEDEDGSRDAWLPAFVVVAVDTQCVHMPPAYAVGYEHFRIRKLKTDMRERFDRGGRGSVHSTDNTRESWEYVDVCFSHDLDAIREEISAHAQSSLFAKIKQFVSLEYLRHSVRHSLREWLIHTFLQ